MKMETMMMETLCEKLSTISEPLFDKEIIDLNRSILKTIHEKIEINSTAQYFKIFVHSMALASSIYGSSQSVDIKNISIVEMLERDN